jgi:S1-C subfamily serine protease
MRNYFGILFGLCLAWCYQANTYADVDDATHLLAYERNTIDVFQHASPNVVFVHRMSAVANKSHNSALHIAPSGSGSGIIWDHDGHIVTNFHVIQGAVSVLVTLGDITVPAKVIGLEPRKDLAVLQVSSPKALEFIRKVTPYAIAPTQKLVVGQKVIAIGSPFGFDHSLTTGVVSALGRGVPGIGGVTIHDMIQTDASINPGNSGGPLLDSSGRLIGVSTVIFSRSGSSAGVGFAIPADAIVRTVTQIIQHGRVILAGIGIQPVAPAIAQRLGVNKGVLIADILPHTPAANAKLHATEKDNWGRIILGDVIIALNKQPIDNYDVLYDSFSKIKVGESVKITLLRGGKKIERILKTMDIGSV